MERIKDFVSIIVNPIWKWIVEIFMGLLSVIIYTKPEWTDRLSFSNLVKGYWWAWLIGGTIIWIVATAWQYANEKAEMRKVAEKVPSPTTMKQENHDGSLGFQGNTFNAPVTFEQVERKSDEESQEVIFHRTYHHREFFILGSTPEQVLNYIRNDVSASLWYFYTSDDFAYDVSYPHSKFYYPDKDNVAIHGAYFHGIKYELERRNDEIKNRRNGVHIPELFWISIAPVGIGANVRLQVCFETQNKEAVEFFSVMRKRLVKMFRVSDGVAGAMR